MSLKITLIIGIALSLTAAGCCAGGKCWSKPGYQAAPAAGSASRTYTPTETVSPYQQGPATSAGSGTVYDQGYQQSPTTYGGSGTTYSQPAPAYSEALPSYGGSGTTSYGGSGAR